MIQNIEARLDKHPLRRPDLYHYEVQYLIRATRLLYDIVTIAHEDRGSEDAYYGEDYETVFHAAAQLLERIEGFAPDLDSISVVANEGLEYSDR